MRLSSIPLKILQFSFQLLPLYQNDECKCEIRDRVLKNKSKYGPQNKSEKMRPSEIVFDISFFFDINIFSTRR